jgi:hypothetical protein
VGVFDVPAAFVRKQRLHLEAHSIRQHTSAYVTAFVSIRQHTSAFDVSAAFVRKQRLHLEAYGLVLTWFSLANAAPSSGSSGFWWCQHTSAYVSICQHTSAYVSIHPHTSAYVSIRPHTSAYVPGLKGSDSAMTCFRTSRYKRFSLVNATISLHSLAQNKTHV